MSESSVEEKDVSFYIHFPTDHVNVSVSERFTYICLLIGRQIVIILFTNLIYYDRNIRVDLKKGADYEKSEVFCF